MEHSPTDIAPARKAPIRHDWAAIDPQIRAMVAERRSRREIWQALGLPRSTVNLRIEALGLSTAGCPSNRYSAGRQRRRARTAARWSPPAEMLRLRRRCAEVFEVSEAALLGSGRARRVSLARQAAAFVLRRRFSLSTKQVALLLGGLCHTTVVHACQRIAWQMRRDPDLAARVNVLLGGCTPRLSDAHVLAWALFRLDQARERRRAAVRPIFEDEELAEFIDPARVHCGQCDRGVLPAEAARCSARLCGLRGPGVGTAVPQAARQVA